ncbi:hypothetical protein, variant [Verruconis gallopava]|nr:hypothetical protein, variant [Verruconis gallopava]KIW09428.1 hypothetical protein, variant [Verruconis gallopava]
MFVDVPGLFLATLGNRDYDWVHQTVPQKGNKGKVHHLPRGKALGGSTAINYMMYVRGSSADYDDWAELTGDESWGSKEMSHYMRKHQTLEPIDEKITDRTHFPFVGEYHGTSGPSRTSFNPSSLPIEEAIIKAADDACGFSVKPKDPWSGDHIGFYNSLGSIIRTGPNKGKRSYVTRGYFEPNAKRPNLEVICESLVHKVLLDGNKATGVEFSHRDKTYQVKVNKEVIVSGGTIKSPQILELSGIGDPEILKAAGVEVKVENKGVGANCQDHAVSGAAFWLTPGELSASILAVPEAMKAAQQELMMNQTGPLTCASLVQGFFPYKLFATPEQLKETVESIRNTPTTSDFHKKQLEQVIRHLESDKSANLQIVLLGSAGDFEKGVHDQSRLFKLELGPEGNCSISIALCLQYPVSRGSIHITSNDPTKDPAIDPGYMSHPADKHVMAVGFGMVDKLSKSKYVADKIASRIWPAKEVDLSDVKQIEQQMEEVVLGEYHICGSVAMGDALDSHLRVKGAEGIRVIDASAFPNNVSGNICSSVYALAEKGADIIKRDNGHALV